jgi:hypothetical protein
LSSHATQFNASPGLPMPQTLRKQLPGVTTKATRKPA